MKSIILISLLLCSYNVMGQIKMDINSIKNVHSNKHLALIVEGSISNKGNDCLFFNKKNEIIFGPLFYENESENSFDGMGFFLYSDTYNLVKDIPSDLGVADIVFFNRKGNLRFVYLEGIENARILKRRTTYYNNNRINVIERIKISPKEKVGIKFYIYIGQKKHIPNNLKYIRFYYKQNKDVFYTDYYEIGNFPNRKLYK